MGCAARMCEFRAGSPSPGGLRQPRGWMVPGTRAPLRNAASMSARFGDYALRVAVKDAATNARMVEILKSVCRS